ncbi:lantibiotic dehydratase [Saccharopolyspora hattusasensis]|uniref:lantibiotic dehydratase n=1 Tax=Saccharopolyspora hattusasensis TaxID=1128679 RepID=UPI003D989467
MNYRVEPTFVVRAAELPLAVLARLRTEKTAQLVEQIVDIQEWLDAQGEPLSDALHPVIGRVTETPLRRRLISLRRDVYQGRAPRAGGPDADLLAAVPAELADALDTWRRKVIDRDALIIRAGDELLVEEEMQRRALHDIASRPAVQRGLVLASRDLYLSLGKWSPSRADRKLERKLAKYLSRMAAKTSPYSTFTASAQGRWSSSTGAELSFDGAGRRSVVELNAFLQQQIPRALATWPEIRAGLPMRVNSSVVEDGEMIRFLGRKDGEAVLELNATPTLRRFLGQVRHGSNRTHGGVVHELAAADRRNRSEEVARFLDQLIDIGLIEIGFELPDNDVDPLGGLVDLLARFDGERVASARESLGRLRSALQDYEDLEAPAARLDQAQAIHDRLRNVYDLLGWSASGEQIPKNAFYEDVLMTGVRPVRAPEPWQELFNDLDLVRRLAGLYDRFLPGQIAAEEFFAEHYGSGAQVHFLDFYSAFCKAIGQPGKRPAGFRVGGAELALCYEQAFPVPRMGIERLDQLADLQETLVALVSEAPVDGEGVRRLPGEPVRDFLRSLPGHVRPQESLACYLQPLAGTDGQPRAVLNELMTGFGRSQARLLRLDHKAGTGAFEQPELPAPGPDGRYYAEVTGTVGSNLNLKRPVTCYEISYPMSTSDRPGKRRIPLNDLVVVHDPQARQLRLVSKSRGIGVIPVHLGMMVEFLLPPAYRFLLQMFGQAVPRFEFIKQLSTASASGELDGVRRYPRLVLGELVVNRASWVVRAQDLPWRPAGGSGVGHLIDVTRWRRRHGIPRQCFVRAIAGHGHAAQKSRVDGMFDKTRKPVYVDFSSALFLNVLDEVVAGTDEALVFEEMLPGPADLVARDGDARRACEFVVELTRGGRDD